MVMKFGYCHTNVMQDVMAIYTCSYFCFQTLCTLRVPKSTLNPDVFSLREKPTVGLRPIAQYQLTVNWLDVHPTEPVLGGKSETRTAHF
jgi:hypothetical protein